jgi:3-isopropylmalate/(R)-2-methylmalate dehydratase small subunit
MKKIYQISGKTIPLAMNDVDTDLIIPAQYLTGVTKEGYGANLFKRLREADANFVFNQDKYQQANILVTQANFGCGSSREHAVWALQEAGIQVIIATSFADIFFSNSSKNGLVLIQLPESDVNKLLAQAYEDDHQLTIDLEQQKITSANDSYDFEFDPFRKHCFINGLNDLDYLFSHILHIKNYENRKKEL